MTVLVANSIYFVNFKKLVDFILSLHQELFKLQNTFNPDFHVLTFSVVIPCMAWRFVKSRSIYNRHQTVCCTGKQLVT